MIAIALMSMGQDFTGSYCGNLIGEQSIFFITDQKETNDLVGEVYHTKQSKLFFKGKSLHNSISGSIYSEGGEKLILLNGVFKQDTLQLDLQSESDSSLKKSATLIKVSNRLYNQVKIDFYFDHNPKLIGSWLLIGQESNGKSSTPKEFYSVTYSPDGLQSLQSSSLREQTKKLNLKNYQSTTKWRTQDRRLILTFEGSTRGSLENSRFYEIKGDTLIISNTANPSNKSKFIRK